MFRKAWMLLFLLPIPSLGQYSYQEKAQKVTQYIQHNFWNRRERQYRRYYPGNYTESADNSQVISTIWPAGCIQLQVLALAAKSDAKYRSHMEYFYHRMDSYWTGNAYDAFVGRKTNRFFDDNGQVAINIIYAYRINKNPIYLRRAEQTVNFCYSGKDNYFGGGIWMFEDKEHATLNRDCKTMLSNYTPALATLLLAEHKTGQIKENLINQASEIMEWGKKTFQDDGTFGHQYLYKQSISVKPQIGDNHFLSYNNANVIRCYLQRYRLNNNKADLEEALKIGGDASNWFYEEPGKEGCDRGPTAGVHLMIHANFELFKETNEERYVKRIRDTVNWHWNYWEKVCLQTRNFQHPDDRWLCSLEYQSSIAYSLWIMALIENGIVY